MDDLLAFLEFVELEHLAKEVDSNEAVFTVIDCSDEDITSSSAASGGVPVLKEAENRRLARIKSKRLTPKQELAVLGVQVVQLTNQLNELKAIKLAHVSDNDKELAVGGNQTDVPVWEAVARNQYERRRQTETENEELHAAVSDIKRRAKRLRYSVIKHAKE